MRAAIGMARRFALTLAGGVVLFSGATFAQRASDPASATVFIRVVGSIELELDEVWTEELRYADIEVGTGSGFVFSPYGHVLTNHHVIAEEEFETIVEGRPVRGSMSVDRIEVVVPSISGQGTNDALVLPASIEAVDPELDLAVLSVSGLNLSYLALGDSEAVEQGQAVRAYGFPFGRKIEIGLASLPDIAPRVSVSSGSIAARRQGSSGDTAFLQINATVNPGNSGGPLVDEEAYVRGVIRLKLKSADSVGFAIPINAVKDFLRLHGYDGLLPVEFLEPGSLDRLEDKLVELAFPRGMEDLSRSLTQVFASRPSGVEVWVDRVATTWSNAQLEQALVSGGGFHRFEQRGAKATSEHAGSLLGFASGVDTDSGAAKKLQYLVLPNPGHAWERVLVRVIGPADEVAFNESILRDVVAGVRVESMLTGELAGALPEDGWQWVARGSPQPDTPPVPFPRDWPVEEVGASGCRFTEPATPSGLSALMPGDFTVSLRSSFFARGPEEMTASELAVACGGARGTQTPRYRKELEWLGIDYHVEGLVLPAHQGLLQVEIVVPRDKADWVVGLWKSFLRELELTYQSPAQ